MYRQNRIGPWPLGNLNKALIVDSKANFNSHDSAFTTYGCYSLNTSSGNKYTKEHFVFSDNTGVDLADGMQVGIGVQISPHELDIDADGPDYQYALSGQLSFRAADGLLIEAVLGRLGGAPNEAAHVAVANPVVCPLDVMALGNGVYIASVNKSIVTLKGDGGSLPGTAYDIAAFWRIWNETGSAQALTGMCGNIGLHKYEEDITNWDPPRV